MLVRSDLHPSLLCETGTVKEMKGGVLNILQEKKLILKYVKQQVWFQTLHQILLHPEIRLFNHPANPQD